MADLQVLENFSNPIWRLNNLYWIVNKEGKKVPFRLNDVQQQLINELWFLNLILKSRQHGMTTVVDIMGLDQALFSENFAAGIVAHTREDVEKIFRTKVKFPYDNLPEGLKAARPANTDTAKMLAFGNGSSIEVATSLRSGTYRFVHVSEFGKICAKFPDKAKEIVTGTFETVHPGSYLFVESTAEGREGYYYRYVQEAQKRQQMGKKPNKLQFKLHFFAWYRDPFNRLAGDVHIIPEYKKYFESLQKDHGIELDQEQQAWYQTKAETLDDDIKREHPSTIEEAFEAAVSGAYLAKQMGKLRTNGQITLVPHDPSLPVNTGWDFGLNDRMCIWLHQAGGLQHRLIKFITGTDEDILFYWRELERLNYNWGTHFLPHDADTRRIGTAKNADEQPKTLRKILEDAGMRNVRVVPKIDDKRAAIQESKLFLPMCWIDADECKEGIDGLDNFRREWDDKIGDWKDRPLHNWAMHHYDAYETIARGIRKYGCTNTAVASYAPPRTMKARRK
jgi:hypothetical protein